MNEERSEITPNAEAQALMLDEHAVLPSPTPARRRWPVIVALLTGVALAGGVFASARKRPASAAPPRDTPLVDGHVIRFSDAFAVRAGIKSELATSRALLPHINVSGTVAYDGRRFAAVGSRIAGRVRHIHKVVGDVVQRHEVLAEIESVDLARAMAQVISARAKELAAKAHMARESQLAHARIASKREAEVAHADHAVARAERLAAERTVQALGGNSGKAGVLFLRAPMAGRVVGAKLTQGRTVEPTDTAFEIADLSSVWVELAVFERDIGALHIGDRVEIASQIDPSKHQSGRIAYIGHVIDLSTRSAPVRVVTDNRQGLFRPGQSVQASVYVSRRQGRVLAVPRAAVTRIDGKATLFVLLDKNTADIRAVTLGAEDATHVGIVRGLRPNERVVVAGVFELKSELFR